MDGSSRIEDPWGTRVRGGRRYFDPAARIAMSGHSETRRPRFDPDGAVAAANRIERPPKHARPRAMNGLRRRARSERRPLKAREPPRGRPRDATMMRSDDSGAVPPVPIRWSVKLSTYPYKATTGT